MPSSAFESNHVSKSGNIIFIVIEGSTLNTKYKTATAVKKHCLWKAGSIINVGVKKEDIDKLKSSFLDRICNINPRKEPSNKYTSF